MNSRSLTHTFRKHSCTPGVCKLTLAALVTTATAVSTVASSSSPAAAQSLQQQANSLASEIVSQSLKLHSLALSREQAKAQIAADTAKLATAMDILNRDRTDLSRVRSSLAKSAIDIFVTTSSYSQAASFLSSPLPVDAIRTDYEQVASEKLTNQEELYRHDQEVVDALTAQIQDQLQRQQQLLSTIDQQNRQISQQVAAESAELSQIKGEIAKLVQQALAAKENSRPQGLPLGSGIAAAVNLVSHAPTTPPSQPATSISGPATPQQLLALRECESGNNYAANTGNGYYGAYQFAESTWLSLGYGGYPYQAPPATQDQAAEQLLARAGWGQWPACSALLGY